MSKSPTSKLQLDPKYKSFPTSSDTLMRRPIHMEQEHLDERYKERNIENKKDSPSKSGRLYPELSDDEDELDIQLDQNEKSESFQESRRRRPESQNLKEKESFDKFRVRKALNVSPVVNQTESSLFKYIIIVILVLSLMGFLYMYTSHTKDQSKTRAEVSITQIVEGMENHFKDQHFLTYRILKLALKKVAEQEPSAPAIITFIANKKAESTASEISQYLAEALAPQKYVLINESAYWHDGPDVIKLKIDEEIRSKLTQNNLNVVIVDNLQKIPYEAMMIFHSYCDHELAPYKRAVFLFIVSLNEILPENADGKHIDVVAMRQLRNIWHRAADDDINSLITRITVNVVNIR